MEKPDLRVNAIMRNSSSKLEIPCILKIWNPLDAHEDFRLQVEVKGRVARTDRLFESAWTISSPQSPRQVQLENAYVQRAATHMDSSGQLTGLDIHIDCVERLIVSNSLGTEPSPAKHCVFFLSDLDYGTDQHNVTWSYLGGGKLNSIEPLTIACPAEAPFEFLKLTRYYQYRNEQQPRRTVVGSQAVLVADVESLTRPADSADLLAYARDVALLLSLAARHPVDVISDRMEGENWTRESHWRPLERLRSGQEDEPFRLIEATEFEDFIKLALASWQVMQPEKLEALRNAIAALNPWKIRPASDNFLKMFTALEGLTDKPPVDESRRALQASAKQLIKAVFNEIDGLPEGEKKSWEKNIPKLWQGRAQQGKLVALLQRWNIVEYGLWPMIKTQDGHGLLDIRNDLAHGRLFTRNQQMALICATSSLKSLLERVVLSMLNYPYLDTAAMSTEAFGLGENWRASLVEYQRQLKP